MNYRFAISVTVAQAACIGFIANGFFALDMRVPALVCIAVVALLAYAADLFATSMRDQEIDKAIADYDEEHVRLAEYETECRDLGIDFKWGEFAEWQQQADARPCLDPEYTDADGHDTLEATLLGGTYSEKGQRHHFTEDYTEEDYQADCRWSAGLPPLPRTGVWL